MVQLKAVSLMGMNKEILLYVPSSSFSITVEDMELHHFASLTSCLFYFSGKKMIASPSTILVGRTVPIHEPVLVLMHSILVEAGELGADP